MLGTQKKKNAGFLKLGQSPVKGIVVEGERVSPYLDQGIQGVYVLLSQMNVNSSYSELHILFSPTCPVLIWNTRQLSFLFRRLMLSWGLGLFISAYIFLPTRSYDHRFSHSSVESLSFNLMTKPAGTLRTP
jgi:hypothetical protein